MPLTRVGKLSVIGAVVVAIEIPVFTVGLSEWTKCNQSSGEESYVCNYDN